MNIPLWFPFKFLSFWLPRKGLFFLLNSTALIALVLVPTTYQILCPYAPQILPQLKSLPHQNAKPESNHGKQQVNEIEGHFTCNFHKCPGCEQQTEEWFPIKGD